jgi:uncharacterized membrane protein HdeD (DUF308 family)
MTSSVPARRAALQDPEVAAQMARRWWLFLVTGSLWILFSLIVFRFDLDSVTAVGIAVGAVCFAAGVNEFLTLGVTSGGWKVVRAVLGVLFVVIGIVALAYPDRTFVEVAAIFSFFLVLKGAFDAMYGLMSRGEAEYWWVGLIIGTIEILLGFWAAGNFGREAVLLVVWIGAGALARGVTELTLAAALHRINKEGLPPAGAISAPPGTAAPA